MEKSFLWACQTDHSEQGRVSIRAAMRPNNVAVCNITSFFFKEEIMTIRTIVDFAKKHVVQLELEFLKVFTSNYDGWGKNLQKLRRVDSKDTATHAHVSRKYITRSLIQN